MSGARQNNFDFLRLCAASIVVIGHAFPIMGMKQPELLRNPISIFGLVAFFSISGYLIAGSWLNDPNILRFFAKRALRIFPALIALVGLTVFVLGPIESSLPIAEYFANARTYNYLKSAALYIAYDLPGLFDGNPIRGTVNVSLWSLPAEFFMYLITPAALIIFARRPIALALLSSIFAAGAVYVGYFYTGPKLVVYATEVRAALAMGAYFLAGAFIRVVKDRITFSLKSVLILSLTYALLSHWFDGWLRYPIAIFVSLAVPYIVISLAKRSTPILRETGRAGDFSYGIYLYAFPIQQVIAAHFPQMNVWHVIALTFSVTVPCAFASWHLVEKRTLGLKATIPLRRELAFPPGQTQAGN
jgi:peptidoglycan/LPS O-acetylase OafA/YrhL